MISRYATRASNEIFCKKMEDQIETKIRRFLGQVFRDGETEEDIALETEDMTPDEIENDNEERTNFVESFVDNVIGGEDWKIRMERVTQRLTQEAQKIGLDVLMKKMETQLAKETDDAREKEERSKCRRKINEDEKKYNEYQQKSKIQANEFKIKFDYSLASLKKETDPNKILDLIEKFMSSAKNPNRDIHNVIVHHIGELINSALELIDKIQDKDTRILLKNRLKTIYSKHADFIFPSDERRYDIIMY